MLDKSVPYHSVIMKRPPGLAIPTPLLVPGFTLVRYDRNATDWAKIESSVGEFDTEIDAAAHVHQYYLPFESELPDRVILVKAPSGDLVGTITAWWEDATPPTPLVHWLGVMPEFQHRGLGQALAAECLRVLHDLYGDRTVWLHTQTWSHAAIKIYLRLGFVIALSETFGRHQNQASGALPILERLIPKELLKVQ